MMLTSSTTVNTVWMLDFPGGLEMSAAFPSHPYDPLPQGPYDASCYIHGIERRVCFSVQIGIPLSFSGRHFDKES